MLLPQLMFSIFSTVLSGAVEDPDAGEVSIQLCQNVYDNVPYNLYSLLSFLLCPCAGLSLGDILKPELVSPLIETLPFQQRLAPYLPEV